MADDEYKGGWGLGESLFPNQRLKPLLQSWWGGTMAKTGQVDRPGRVDLDAGTTAPPEQPDGGGFYTGLTPYQPDTALEPFRRLRMAQEALYDPKVTAMLAAIRGREGPQYNVIAGGQIFDDYSQHTLG